MPVDEVVTLTLFYREDDHLRRLMLDDAQAAELDRLWDELHFVSQDALTLVDAFQQLLEYATPGRRSQGLRAAAQADQRPGRGVSPGAGRRPSRGTSTRSSRSPPAPIAARSPAPRPASCARSIASCAARSSRTTRRSG